MKKLIPILILGFVFTTQSCVDYLDKDPNVDTKLSYEQIFSDVHYAPGFLNNIYNELPDGYSRFGGAMLAAGSDEAVCSNTGSAINLFNKNAINATTNPDDVWDAMYRGIRKCNIFLKELQPDGIIPNWRNSQTSHLASFQRHRPHDPRSQNQSHKGARIPKRKSINQPRSTHS